MDRGAELDCFVVVYVVPVGVVGRVGSAFGKEGLAKADLVGV